MRWYEIILLLLTLGSFLYLVYKFIKKFPQTARVDVNSLPETKLQALKKNMLDKRLRRKLGAKGEIVWKKLKPVLILLKKIIISLYHDLLEKEKQLRAKRMQSRTATAVGMDSLQQRVGELVKQAKSLFKKDDFIEAEKIFLEVISLDPKNIEAFEGLGDLYLKQKKYNEAKETYNYLLKLSHTEAHYHDKLGKVAKEQGRLQEAEMEFFQSVGLNSQNANYLFDLAEVYILEEEYEKAVEFINKALDLEPNNPKYLDSLLEISIIRKDKVKAGEVLFKLEQVNPENNKISELRQRIEQL